MSNRDNRNIKRYSRKSTYKKNKNFMVNEGKRPDSRKRVKRIVKLEPNTFMLYDNTTSWGNGPRKSVRDYLDNWYSTPKGLMCVFGLEKRYDRYYLFEELDDSIEDDIEENNYDVVTMKEKYTRELVRDYLNSYRVTELDLMRFFSIEKYCNHYYLKEDLKVVEVKGNRYYVDYYLDCGIWFFENVGKENE